MRIHILGIVGQMTTPLALSLIKQGHVVSGSDQEKIYPPFSELISKIPFNQPLGEIDLVIVGSSYKSFRICVEEFEQIKHKNIPYISATEYLSKYLVKTNSILVAGSYGKTTISSILAHILPDSNYFFGGQSINGQSSMNFSSSNTSILEADESINGLDTQAKFLYYPVKYLILTSVNWEHKESYLTEDDNFDAFKKLVQRVPKDGVLIYNPLDQKIQDLLPFCQAVSIPYEKKVFKSNLIGEHNQQNISAAYTLCKFLNIDFDISKFIGIKRRLEIVSNKNNILIIDDFAQSANRVISAINAVKFSYPSRPVKIYFEPHASFLENIQSVLEFESIYPHCQEFVLGKIKFSNNKSDRVSFANWQKILKEKIKYFPISSQIIDYFKNTLQPNDILIHFSSGGLEGLNTLKTVYNNT